MTNKIDIQEAQALGKCVAEFISVAQFAEAYSLLEPLLAEHTPFRMLDRIGKSIGSGESWVVNAFCDHIASYQSIGGWVIIGSALCQQLSQDLPAALSQCRHYVIASSSWYATDILGERIPGPALLIAFAPTLAHITPWREDSNCWVRRTVGVAIHYWAKRSKGSSNSVAEASALLDFLEPMFEERDMRAIKGVGWGLKTLGKYFPELVSEWLTEQVIHKKRNPKMLMLRKATTYLSEEYQGRSRKKP